MYILLPFEEVHSVPNLDCIISQKCLYADICMYSLAINTIFMYLDFNINGIMNVPILPQLDFCILHDQNVIFFQYE